MSEYLSALLLKISLKIVESLAVFDRNPNFRYDQRCLEKRHVQMSRMLHTIIYIIHLFGFNTIEIMK
jgi:hypothetical protein